MISKPIAIVLLATLATPCLAQAAPEPFFSGTIPADPALVGEIPVAPNPNAPGTVSLTPEQREAALEAAATRSGRELDGNGPDRKIHGEMGIEVGTGGERAMYGTAVVPLSDNATAAFSFETGRSNYRWRRY